MKFLPGLFAVLVVASSAAAQSKPSQDVQAAVTQASKQWFDAFLVGDGATMDKLEFPDFTLIQADGRFFQKTQPRATTMKPRKADRTWKTEEVKVHTSGDTAILTHLHVWNMSTGEIERQRVTEVWKRDSGSWRILAGQATSVPTK